MDGVHCVERRNLVDFLGDKLDELLHPVSRIEAVRGSAVGALAECDRELQRWFLARYGDIDEEAKRSIENKLGDNFADSNSSRDKRWQKEGGNLEWKLAQVGSYHLMRITRTLAERIGEDGLPTLEAFKQDLLDPRNILGHAIADRKDDGLVVKSYAGEIALKELADHRRRMARMKGTILEFTDSQKPK